MKQLTLVPEGGLGNRMYAVTSAIAFAKEHNVRLNIIWFKDKGMGAGFYDLFTLSPEIENIEIKEAGLIDFYTSAKPMKSNFFLPRLYRKLKFDAAYIWYKEKKSVREWYVSQPEAYSSFYIFLCNKFCDNHAFFNLLSPVNTIQKRIDERTKLLSPHTIGIHIRRTDLTAAIIQSPLSAFIDKMQQEISIHPETNFYVASDSKEEKNKLTEIFGDRVITVDNNLKRKTKDGIVDALIELYTLASTKKIIGSFYSTYSVLASEIKAIPVEIIQLTKPSMK